MYTSFKTCFYGLSTRSLHKIHSDISQLCVIYSVSPCSTNKIFYLHHLKEIPACKYIRKAHKTQSSDYGYCWGVGGGQVLRNQLKSHKMTSSPMNLDHKYRAQQIVQLLGFLRKLHNFLQGLARSASKFSLGYLEIKLLRRKNSNQKGLLLC